MSLGKEAIRKHVGPGLGHESGRNDPGFALLNRSHTQAVLVVPA